MQTTECITPKQNLVSKNRSKNKTILMNYGKLLIFNLKITQLLKYALFFSAVSYITIYLWMAFYRLQYPFDLEWIEGGMLDQVQRLVNGESIYVKPDINFVPFLYPPLYFYLSAAASMVFGDGLLPLRLVSFGASLVSFTSIFLIVRNETKNLWTAFLSVGLFAATFRVTGAWLDIARVDSLFLALWLMFIYFARSGESLRSSLLAGIFAALAILTKQTTLVLCLPVLVYLFWWNKKHALVTLAVAALIAGTTTLILEYTSTGWYTYYVFRLLSQQTEWRSWMFASFWKDDLLVHLPLALLFVIFFLIGKPKHNQSTLLWWASVLVGALAGTFITRVKVGGYDNVLLPTYAILSILFGLGLEEALKTLNLVNADYKDRIEILIHIMCLCQLVILFYNPFAQIPTTADVNNGYNLVELISKVDGDVFIPDHGHLSILAGKQPYAHHSAIWDILRGNQQTPEKELLSDDLNAAIRQQVFDMIILDTEWNYCCAEIDQYYTKTGDVAYTDNAFLTVTGWKKRPTFIYIAKRLK